jgi:hypothetical protein
MKIEHRHSKLTWVMLTDNPTVIEDTAGNCSTIYAIAFDSFANVFSHIVGQYNPADEDYNIEDENLICHMTENVDEEFCGQAGYSTIEEAIEAIEFIAKNGHAPEGFYD